MCFNLLILKEAGENPIAVNKENTPRGARSKFAYAHVIFNATLYILCVIEARNLIRMQMLQALRDLAQNITVVSNQRSSVATEDQLLQSPCR